jgi:hypothetical protein
MRAPRQMALTPDLVAQVHRVLEDPGPDPTWTGVVTLTEIGRTDANTVT